jgi:hypothetical protein
LHNGGQTGGWLLGSSITVKVDDPTTGKQPDYIGGPFQVFPDPSQLNATVATYYIQGFDVRGGHIVTITDGKYTRQHLVHNIKLTSIDFLNDTISGTTDRGNEICAEFVVEGVWYDFICTSVTDGDWMIDCTVGDVDIEIGTLANFQQRDEDGDSTDLHLYLSLDTDGDGIPDDEDECPNSGLGETVVIDGCDSGVENHLLDGGCTITDLIAECAAAAKNHDKFVSCMAHLINDLKKDGEITGKEQGAILSCAAQADIP